MSHSTKLTWFIINTSSDSDGRVASVVFDLSISLSFSVLCLSILSLSSLDLSFSFLRVAVFLFFSFLSGYFPFLLYSKQCFDGVKHYLLLLNGGARFFFLLHFLYIAVSLGFDPRTHRSLIAPSLRTRDSNTNSSESVLCHTHTQRSIQI